MCSKKTFHLKRKKKTIQQWRAVGATFTTTDKKQEYGNKRFSRQHNKKYEKCRETGKNTFSQKNNE